MLRWSRNSPNSTALPIRTPFTCPCAGGGATRVAPELEGLAEIALEQVIELVRSLEHNRIPSREAGQGRLQVVLEDANAQVGRFPIPLVSSSNSYGLREVESARRRAWPGRLPQSVLASIMASMNGMTSGLFCPNTFQLLMTPTNPRAGITIRFCPPNPRPAHTSSPDASSLHHWYP